MQHKNPTIVGMMVLAALLVFQGCADQSGLNESSPLGSASAPSLASDHSTAFERSTSAATREFSDFNFSYEVSISTYIVDFDPKAGRLVIDYDPKEVKVDDNSYLFAKGDVADKYLSSGTGTANVNDADAIKLSVEALTAGSKIIVYANVVDATLLHAVAVELVYTEHGPSDWQE